jgi:hypothetical protein
MPEVSLEAARRHDGDIAFRITGGGRLRCRWTGLLISRKLTRHGFAGRAVVVEGFPEGPAPGVSFRIHVCAQPGDCDALSNALANAEPPRYHGVVTELLAPDDPPSSSTGPACEAAAGPAAAAEAEALAAAAAQERHPGAEAAEAAVVPGEGNGSAGAAAPRDEALGPAGVVGAGPPAVAPSAPIPLRDQMAAIRDELRTPGAWVGPLAFLLYALKRRRRVVLMEGADDVDVVEAHFPARQWAEWAPVALEDGVCRAVLCKVERVPGDTTVVRMPTNLGEVARMNHYGPVLPMTARAARDPHPPCDGVLCGQARGWPCLSPLQEQLATRGGVSWPVLADGNCAFSTMVVWDNRCLRGNAVQELREELADFRGRSGTCEHGGLRW